MPVDIFISNRRKQMPTLDMLDENVLSFLKECGFANRIGRHFVESWIDSSDDREISVFIYSELQPGEGELPLLTIQLPNNTTLRADLTNARLRRDDDEDETNEEAA
jgi:hypothetical protein